VYPYGDLLYDGTFLYGMTSGDGLFGCGVIFKIRPDGSGYSKLFQFSGVNGNHPFGSLISDGTYLYGMTKEGGVNYAGVIFKIKLDGTGFVKLLDFDGISNGSFPLESLMYDGTFLYGMTHQGGINDIGVIFKIKPDGSSFLKLFDFAAANSGSYPNGSLISDGTYLYGTTSNGGPSSYGVLFKIKPDGNGYENVMTFSDLTTGSSQPSGSLIFDGLYLYGMTTFGGTNYDGTIFRIGPDGTGFTTLLNFKGTSDGAYPIGSVISDGFYLYGMTSEGGAHSKGVLFKLAKSAQGLAETKEKTTIRVYPNPVQEELTVISPGSSLEILNVMGQTLIETKSYDGRSVIDVNNLTRGIYYIVQHNKDKTLVTSFLKE
jgi:uncharacterized repeat protein (TIGR03803 family)